MNTLSPIKRKSPANKPQQQWLSAQPLFLNQAQRARVNALLNQCLAQDAGNKDQPRGQPGNAGQFAKSGASTGNGPSKKSVSLSEVFEIGKRGGTKENYYSNFAKVSHKTAVTVQKRINIDTHGWEHCISDDEVRHILSRHGNEKYERNHGQRAVTKEDIERLPDITANYDSIEYSGFDKSQNTHSFLIKKKIGDEVYCVQEVRTGRKKLIVKTMWIKRCR